jgi:hypothetical protein
VSLGARGHPLRLAAGGSLEDARGAASPQQLRQLGACTHRAESGSKGVTVGLPASKPWGLGGVGAACVLADNAPLYQGGEFGRAFTRDAPLGQAGSSAESNHIRSCMGDHSVCVAILLIVHGW